MSRRPAGSPPTVAIALMVFFMLTAAFVALLSVVIPGAEFIVLAGLMLILIFAAQYFLWGKWLHRYVVESERRKGADTDDGADDGGVYRARNTSPPAPREGSA